VSTHLTTEHIKKIAEMKVDVKKGVEKIVGMKDAAKIIEAKNAGMIGVGNNLIAYSI
jgi:hypothetical protein